MFAVFTINKLSRQILKKYMEKIVEKFKSELKKLDKTERKHVIDSMMKYLTEINKKDNLKTETKYYKEKILEECPKFKNIINKLNVTDYKYNQFGNEQLDINICIDFKIFELHLWYCGYFKYYREPKRNAMYIRVSFPSKTDYYDIFDSIEYKEEGYCSEIIEICYEENNMKKHGMTIEEFTELLKCVFNEIIDRKRI